MKFWLILALAALPFTGSAASGVKLRNSDTGRAMALACLQDPSSLDAEPALGLKEVALFAGATVTWAADPKICKIQLHGDEFSLTLGQPWVWINSTRREFLPEGLRLIQGRPALGKSAARRLVEILGLRQITFQDASAGEIPPTPTPWQSPTPQVIPGNEPLLATPGEPVLAPPRPSQAQPKEKPAGVNVVVLDPGHGGYDSGAVSRARGKEKDYCLDIALILRQSLQKSLPGLKIILTRGRDAYVSLKDRCDIANKAGADLFISIHNNSAPSSRGHGTQVFFYDSQSSNKDAEFLARQENANANYLEITLMDLEKSQVRDQSIQLARDVEGELVSSLKLKGRRLQYAPFYVLAKTKMPAILVETAFISNPQEARLLASRAFRGQVAQAIAEGLKKNIERADEE